jgi:hypothetical protein
VGGRIEAPHGKRQRQDTGTAILLLLPLLVLVIGLIVYPIYRAVWLSFTDKLVGYPERFVGLRNYIYLANDDAFRTVVRNSLVFTVSSVALKIVTGLGMALVLHATWRWRNFFRGLMLRTFMRAMRFWPAAILSSLVFALLHTYEVSTLAGAVTLAGVVELQRAAHIGHIGGTDAVDDLSSEVGRAVIAAADIDRGRGVGAVDEPRGRCLACGTGSRIRGGRGRRLAS